MFPLIQLAPYQAPQWLTRGFNNPTPTLKRAPLPADMAKNRPRTKRLLTDELYIPNAFKQDLCTCKINEIRKKKHTQLKS